MRRTCCLSLIQDIFKEKHKNGEDTKPLLEKLGNPEATKNGILYSSRILKSMNSKYFTWGKGATKFLRLIVAELFQERREALNKPKIDSEPPEKAMKPRKRELNSENGNPKIESETPKKKTKLWKRKLNSEDCNETPKIGNETPKIGNKPPKRAMKLRKRLSNSENETETSEKKMKLRKRK